ncbi:pleckstrin homology domain-containing family G member 3-like isoform X2 [Dysidea avara]|uniref:pleckstrin homology domain-containing family G member 3-like isoform X2 n=1 Tax=Dysidea avara TaxID=196820 RepID=UPI00331CE2AA
MWECDTRYFVLGLVLGSIVFLLQKCQQKLGHMLPLGAYLLKPVQRVLKYALLLEKINDCLIVGEDGKEDIMFTVGQTVAIFWNPG